MNILFKDAQTVVTAVRSCKNAVKKDRFRPVLQTVELDGSNNPIVFTALNGIIMIQRCVTATVDVPGKITVLPDDLLAMIGKHQGAVRLSSEEKTLTCTLLDCGGLAQIDVKQIDIENLEHIQHRCIWPEHWQQPYTIAVDPKCLMTALKGANDQEYVTLTVDAQKPFVFCCFEREKQFSRHGATCQVA